MKRNWETVLLKALGGRDFRLTVLATEPVGDRYQRLRMDDGGLLKACGVHPTMWIRLWFDNNGRPHQRAYTLVDPDPTAGQFSLEFALHDGCAARWATAAAAGDSIDATVLGSKFAWPDPRPEHVYVIGDAASLPAVNSLLDSAGDIPATVWLEYAHDGERALPVRSRQTDSVTWLPRGEQGRQLVDSVRAELPASARAFYWVACEASTTRTLVKHLRRDLGVDKRRVSALAYWSAK